MTDYVNEYGNVSVGGSGVIQLQWIPMGIKDKELLLRDLSLHENEHHLCTQWLLLLVDEAGGQAVRYYPCADDKSSPEDKPYGVSGLHDGNAEVLYSELVESFTNDTWHTNNI